MNELEKLRKEIDRIDRQLLPLFLERMELCSRVADYKRGLNLPVLDAQREKEVLKEKMSLAEGTDMQSEVYDFFNSIMSISRTRQTRELNNQPEKKGIDHILTGAKKTVKNPTVCFFGSSGSYSEEAVIKHFGDKTKRFSARTFEDVFINIKNQKADYGVLPVENSSTGTISEVIDLLSRYGFYITGEGKIQIRHCLLGVKGADLSDIKKVYSHQQGILQSQEFLNTLGGVVCETQDSTAVSAKMVADLNDKSIGAIAGRRNAHIYSLDILAEDINSYALNTTRFIIISRNFEVDDNCDKISITFTLSHQSGQLHRILSSFAQGGLNLLKLESRPIPQKPFEYRFYADYTGSLLNQHIKEVTNSGIDGTVEFRLLGNYPSYKEKEDE